MKTAFALLAAGLFLLGDPVFAQTETEHHVATRLGGLTTRFAPPSFTPTDLRARFADPRLKSDIASILEQWGWAGNLTDLHGAAQTNAIVEWKVLVGTTMPFMSSREDGQPICLRNVLWAGQEPAPAYAFTFASKGRLYRCVTPKACSNFFLEDLGPEPKDALALDCSAPVEALSGRPVEVCLTLRNEGNRSEPKALLVLPVPPGAEVVSATGNAVLSDGRLTWEMLRLGAGATQQVCAIIKSLEPGRLDFRPTVAGTRAQTASSACETRIVGIPAILLEVMDLDDPIEVGKEVTYEIRVTNQGSAPATDLRLICTLSASQEFSSATGATEVDVAGGTVTMKALSVLAPKAQAVWQVVVRAARPEDARFKVELRGDQYDRPIDEDEATHQY